MAAIEARLQKAVSEEIAYLCAAYGETPDAATTMLLHSLQPALREDSADSSTSSSGSGGEDSDEDVSRRVDYLCRIRGLTFRDAERVVILSDELRKHAHRASTSAACTEDTMLVAIERLCDKLRMMRPRVELPAAAPRRGSAHRDRQRSHMAAMSPHKRARLSQEAEEQAAEGVATLELAGELRRKLPPGTAASMVRALLDSDSAHVARGAGGEVGSAGSQPRKRQRVANSAATTSEGSAAAESSAAEKTV